MKSISLIPMLLNSEELPQEGLFIETPNFCRKVFNHKCKEYYISIFNSKGFHTCPYSFTSFVPVNGIVFTGLRTRRYGIGRKSDKDEYGPELPLNTIEKLSKETLGTLAEFGKAITFNQQAQSRMEGIEKNLGQIVEFVNSTIHEIRKLNKNIKIQAYDLSRSLDEFEKLSTMDIVKARRKNMSVITSASLISTRLDVYDLEMNPQLNKYVTLKPMKVHGKFKKAAHSLEGLSSLKGIKISFIGVTYFVLNAKDSFEMLPYLLFENAIKYSPENEEIICQFIEKDGHLTVSISNTGPSVDSEENINSLLEKGKRGKRAQEIVEGTGVGLYYSSVICKEHGISMNLACTNVNDERNIESLSSIFSVSLLFPKS